MVQTDSISSGFRFNTSRIRPKHTLFCTWCLTCDHLTAVAGPMWLTHWLPGVCGTRCVYLASERPLSPLHSPGHWPHFNLSLPSHTSADETATITLRSNHFKAYFTDKREEKTLQAARGCLAGALFPTCSHWFPARGSTTRQRTVAWILRSSSQARSWGKLMILSTVSDWKHERENTNSATRSEGAGLLESLRFSSTL